MKESTIRAFAKCPARVDRLEKEKNILQRQCEKKRKLLKKRILEEKRLKERHIQAMLKAFQKQNEKEKKRAYRNGIIIGSGVTAVVVTTVTIIIIMLSK